jgi:hypothetical protein
MRARRKKQRGELAVQFLFLELAVAVPGRDRSFKNQPELL